MPLNAMFIRCLFESLSTLTPVVFKPPLPFLISLFSSETHPSLLSIPHFFLLFLCSPRLRLSVHSKTEWTSSSVTAPNLPPPPSLNPFLQPFPPPYIQPPHPAFPVQHTRASPYAFTVPAFTRAHPPALPKIFKPTAGSGTHMHAPSRSIRISVVFFFYLVQDGQGICCRSHLKLPTDT